MELEIYFGLIESEVVLAVGGRVYTGTHPPCELMLHWKYGTEREGGKINNAYNKGPAFMSNNFLIKREIFSRLDNSFHLPGYGHEDTWWGIQFEQSGIQCNYINNPVLHSSLEKSGVYLVKTENAIANLLLLKDKTDENLIIRHVKIYRWYRRLKYTGFAAIYIFFEKPFHHYFRKNLLSCKPNLFYFDCYRLAILIRLAKLKSVK